MPRTAVNAPLIRGGDRAGATPGPANTTAPLPTASARGVGPGVSQPRHEQGDVFDAGLPAAARLGAPAERQRDRVRIRLGRGLRAVAAEPLLPQEIIGDGDYYLQILVQYRWPDGL
jgi:hypothetical protein